VARGLERGDVVLYRFASPDKRRPVVILTRGSATRYLTQLTVAPVTSTIRGVPSEVVLGVEDGMKDACAVNLHNLVTVDRARLGRRVTKLSDNRMAELCRAVGFALGCDG